MTRPSVVQQPKPVGPVYEDGSYRVGGGRVYDPDTGRVRKRTVLPPVQQGPRLEAAQPPPKRPNFTTVMRAQKGDQQARVQIRRYEQHRQATAAAKAQVQALQDQAFFGEALLAVQGAYKTVNPIADAIIKSLSPTEAAKSVYGAARRGDVGMAALNAAAILPFGRGLSVAEKLARAEKAGAVAEAGLAGRRSLTVGEKAQQLPRARSRLAQALIEKPADVLSQAMMGQGKTARAARRVLPSASAEARVAKAAGRETMLEGQRAQAGMVQHLKALPKEGSPADVAHFWWAQLPASHRNAEGLRLVRGKQAAELQRVTSGKALASLQKQKAAIEAKLRASRQPKESDSLRAAYAAYVREDPVAPDRMTLEEFAARYPELETEAAPVPKISSPSPLASQERFALMNDLQDVKLRISDLPQLAKDTSLSIAQLDKVIARPPKLNPKVIGAVHALSGDRQLVLEQAKLLKPERAAARKGLVSQWLGPETWRSFEEFNVSPPLALEALFVQLRRELAGATVESA